MVKEMASIIKKNIKGKIYYYYTESKRINGKTKRVKQIYLGSAESIVKKLDAQNAQNAQNAQKPIQPIPIYSKIESFADVCLIYDLADRLTLVEMINQCFPKRSQGLSLGEYSLIAE